MASSAMWTRLARGAWPRSLTGPSETCVQSATLEGAGDKPYAVAMVFAGQTAVQDGDLAPVSGKYGLVRSDGLLLAPAAYDSVLWTQSGYAALQNAEGCTLYDVAAGKALPGLYQAVGEYGEGLIPVCQNGLWGYLDAAKGTPLGEGCVWMRQSPSARGWPPWRRASSTDISTPPRAAHPPAIYRRGRLLRRAGGRKREKRWGFIDSAGTVVLAPAYTPCTCSRAGCAP